MSADELCSKRDGQRFEHLNADEFLPGNLWACNRCGAVVWLRRLNDHLLLCWASPPETAPTPASYQEAR